MTKVQWKIEKRTTVSAYVRLFLELSLLAGALKKQAHKRVCVCVMLTQCKM